MTEKEKLIGKDGTVYAVDTRRARRGKSLREPAAAPCSLDRERERMRRPLHGWSERDVIHAGVPQEIVDEMPDSAIANNHVRILVERLTSRDNPWTPFDQWPRDARLMVYSGDFNDLDFSELLQHYGLGDSEGMADSMGVALDPSTIRHFAALRSKWPRYFKPPKGKVWRGTSLSRRQLHRILGENPGVAGERKVNATVPLRFHRSWTMRKRVAAEFQTAGSARYQAKRSYEEGTVKVPNRYAVLLEAADSSQFVLNPKGIYKLTGEPRIAIEREVIPAGPVKITKIEWYSLARGRM
jgi:hypothetical protein